MTNLQEQIQIAEDALLKMKEEFKQSEKLELLHVGRTIYTDGDIGISCTAKQRLNGATRATRELAEIASNNMITRNRLEAYCHQLEPEWRDNIGQKSYYLYVDESGAYSIGSTVYIRQTGTVHMSHKTAEIICKKLNTGEIEL